MTKRARIATFGRAAMLAAALGGCAGGDDRPAGDGTPAAPGGLGGFLAGRFAQAQGDTGAAADLFLTAARADPETIELTQRAFALLLAEGRHDEAAPLADRLLAIDDESPLPLLLPGERAPAAGQGATAAAHLEHMPRKGLTAFAAPLLLAWAQAMAGDTESALATLEPKGDTRVFAPIYDFHLGLVADLAGRADLAERHLKAAVEAQPTLRVVQALGAFYQRAGRLDEARALYARHQGDTLDHVLFDADATLARGRAAPRPVANATEGLAEALLETASLARQGNATDIALLFGRFALALRPDFPLAQLLLADLLTRNQRLADANAVYGAMERGPAGDFARLRLALNLDAMGDTAGAVAELSRLAAADSTAVEPLVAWGDLLRRHKRFAEAVPVYRDAIARARAAAQPPPAARLWPLHFGLGIVLERARQWPEAEAELREALRLHPDQPDVLNYLGYTWIDRGENLVEGRTLLERAVQARPNDGAIVDSLGWALYKLGDVAGAVRHLERAVELNPHESVINEHLGDALWRAGRVIEARFQWQRALSLDPEPDQIEALKAKIESGRLPSSDTTRHPAP